MSKLSRITPASLASNPRASLTSWLRYEHIVKAAFDISPKPYTYTPRDLAASSVCSKLRDAVRGCIAFDYPCFTKTKVLATWWASVVVTHDADNVYIQPPKPKEAKKIEGTSHSEAEFSFSTLTDEDLDAFAMLLCHERIKGPIIITKPCEEWKAVTDQFTNVEAILRSDGTLILL